MRQLLLLSLYHATSSLFYTIIKISVLGMGRIENKALSGCHSRFWYLYVHDSSHSLLKHEIM